MSAAGRVGTQVGLSVLTGGIVTFVYSLPTRPAGCEAGSLAHASGECRNVFGLVTRQLSAPEAFVWAGVIGALLYVAVAVVEALLARSGPAPG